MSYIQPGRPKKYSYHFTFQIPRTSGIYRIRSEEDDFKYIGLSNDINRRVREHKKTQKMVESDYVEILKLKAGISPNDVWDALKTEERNQIERHNPSENKTSGGEGHKPKNFFLDGEKIEIDIPISEETFEECSCYKNNSVWIRRICCIVALIVIGIFISRKPEIKEFVLYYLRDIVIPQIKDILLLLSNK